MSNKPPSPSLQSSSLGNRLAAILPKGVAFGVYHLSTPPQKTDALCSAPPNERPIRTYCETQFLVITINVPSNPKAAEIDDESAPSPTTTTASREVMVLGVEVFIYTTAYSTTFFVSKADSTGYLHLLNLPKGTPSPIRRICTAFIQHLIEHRKRCDVQSVVSLFARSQGQYLFPGSVEHGRKHVLDDRGLIKWWCRVLDLLSTASQTSASAFKEGYLIVPGLDIYETRAFLPRAKSGGLSWVVGHPLEKISHYSKQFDWVPPRCLIPRFPDDPKSRFRDELDDEATRSGAMKTTGSWKSVETLDLFWEMMAYRQECSSGRMTGFIWAVSVNGSADHLEDKDENKDAPRTPEHQGSKTVIIRTPGTTPRKLFPSRIDDSDEARAKSKSKKKRVKLKGPIKPRQPKIKTGQRNLVTKMPVKTAYYYWPPEGRGERIVNETTYKRIHELLLHTDFSTLEKAIGSSKRWIDAVGIGHGWGKRVVGKDEFQALHPVNNLAGPVQIPSGLIKRKRADSAEHTTARVNVLDTGLVKKRAKEEHSATSSDRQQVNTLASGLVRKKDKT